MPDNYEQEPFEVIDENTVEAVIPEPVINSKIPVMKPTYTNLGLDTASLVIPKAPGLTTRSKGKLKLDNEIPPLDETINSLQTFDCVMVVTSSLTSNPFLVFLFI